MTIQQGDRGPSSKVYVMQERNQQVASQIAATEAEQVPAPIRLGLHVGHVLTLIPVPTS